MVKCTSQKEPETRTQKDSTLDLQSGDPTNRICSLVVLGRSQVQFFDHACKKQTGLPLASWGF